MVVHTQLMDLHQQVAAADDLLKGHLWLYPVVEMAGTFCDKMVSRVSTTVSIESQCLRLMSCWTYQTLDACFFIFFCSPLARFRSYFGGSGGASGSHNLLGRDGAKGGASGGMVVMIAKGWIKVIVEWSFCFPSLQRSVSETYIEHSGMIRWAWTKFGFEIFIHDCYQVWSRIPLCCGDESTKDQTVLSADWV